MRKSVVRIIAAMALALGMISVASPAQAGSGGGCQTTTAIQACISQSGQFLVADFYLVQPSDFSRCWVYLDIVNSGSGNPMSSPQYHLLGAQGHYGPLYVNIAGKPASSARARVRVYTCSDALHYTAWSPTQYYP